MPNYHQNGDPIRRLEPILLNSEPAIVINILLGVACGTHTLSVGLIGKSFTFATQNFYFSRFHLNFLFLLLCVAGNHTQQKLARPE